MKFNFYVTAGERLETFFLMELFAKRASFYDKVLVLDVDKKSGVVVESKEQLIVETIHNLLNVMDDEALDLSYVQEDDGEGTTTLKFEDLNGHLEIIFFDDDAQMISFLHDADLANTWIVS